MAGENLLAGPADLRPVGLKTSKNAQRVIRIDLQLWQNLVTSGWQAVRSRSLPWFIAAGGGCGGNCWAAAAAAATTKAIDKIDIRIMVPPFAGVRPVPTR